MADGLTGWAAEQILTASLGSPMSTAMYEGLCAGNAQWTVNAAVVCYAPTLEVLRRAALEKRTFIVSREHPYFLHGGLNYGYATGGLEAALKDDPVVKAKREVVETNQLMVYRFGAAWDNFNPSAQSVALARAMGFKPIETQSQERSRGVLCDIPPSTLAALAQKAADRLKTRSPRIVGNPVHSVRRLAVLAGESDPKRGLAQLLSDPQVDGILTGAGGIIDEVDGAIAYFRDLIASGRRIAMLAVGYGPSQDPGCEDMAKWLRSALPNIDVAWWPATDPAWIPRA